MLHDIAKISKYQFDSCLGWFDCHSNPRISTLDVCILHTTPPRQFSCSERVSSFCSTSGTRSVALVRNPVTSHEWGKDREAFTTIWTYPWSFMTQIFRYVLIILESAITCPSFPNTGHTCTSDWHRVWPLNIHWKVCHNNGVYIVRCYKLNDRKQPNMSLC